MGLEQGRLARKLDQLARFDVVIVDELGYVPFDKAGFISRRYERGSLVVTTNLPFARWSEVFLDATAAAAVIDRIVHHATVLTTNGDSYRLKAAQRNQTAQEVAVTAAPLTPRAGRHASTPASATTSRAADAQGPERPCGRLRLRVSAGRACPCRRRRAARRASHAPHGRLSACRFGTIRQPVIVVYVFAMRRSSDIGMVPYIVRWLASIWRVA